MKPTVGRIVHYTPPNPGDWGEHENRAAAAMLSGEIPPLAAIVSGVNPDGTLTLTVCTIDAGTVSVRGVAESATGEPGTWRWPERV